MSTQGRKRIVSLSLKRKPKESISCSETAQNCGQSSPTSQILRHELSINATFLGSLDFEDVLKPIKDESDINKRPKLAKSSTENNVVSSKDSALPVLLQSGDLVKGVSTNILLEQNEEPDTNHIHSPVIGESCDINGNGKSYDNTLDKNDRSTKSLFENMVTSNSHLTNVNDPLAPRDNLSPFHRENSRETVLNLFSQPEGSHTPCYSGSPILSGSLGKLHKQSFQVDPVTPKSKLFEKLEGQLTPKIDDDMDELDCPWENSVYVPRTPRDKSAELSPSVSRDKSNVQSKTAVDQNRSIDSPILRDLGISRIDWNETISETGHKVEAALDNLLSPGSIPFHEKFQRQLIKNGTRPVTPNTLQAVPPLSHQGRPFFGLPNQVKELFQKLRGIGDLYDWQKSCLSMPELQERHNLVYALPTSGGKTLVAEILMLKEVLIHKKNVIFILPYVSIVQEKVRALSQFAVELDFLVEEYAAGKGAYPPRKRRCKNSVFIATIEKALGLVNSLLQEQRLHEVGLVIVDELHLVGEGSRGATLEAVLTKLLFVQENIHIVGMSATIGNLREVAAFLNARTFTGDFRPVELREFIKCGDSVYKVNRNLPHSDTLPMELERTIQAEYTQQQLQNDPDLIGALVMEVVPEESCLIFCPSRKNCENVAILICQTIPGSAKDVRVEEKKALYRALCAEGNGVICPILKQTLPFGVAYHHSGLTTAERRLLEEAFLARTVCVICCTSTLAAGVNLPARRVILRSPYIGTEFIDLSRYKQMVGRAGRAGFGGFGESIMICLLKDIDRVIELMSSTMNDSLSCLAAEDGAGVKALVLSSVGLHLATCREELHKLIKHTLLWVQAEKLGVCVKQLTDKCVVDLLAEGGFQVIDSPTCDAVDDGTDVLITSLPSNGGKKQNIDGNRCEINLHTQLCLSRLGEAAVKGSITMATAHRLYDDLKLAQGSLVLLNYLHLLYIVTPYQMVEQIKSTRQVYFNVYMGLSSDELKAANILGITEGVIMSVMKGRAVKTLPQDVIDRFYLTLMLYELWHEKSVWHVSSKYQVSRGQVYTLLTAASTFASCVLRFSEVLEEFWCFQKLLGDLVQRLSHCCAVELLPLMELPAVKIGRARQLYNAGYRTLRDVAAAEPARLIREVDHMPRKTAYQIIAAAKLLLIEKAEALRDEAADYLEGLTVKNKTITT